MPNEINEEDKELPNYFDSFEPNRVKQGEAITKAEMSRRLAHYLHIPQKYGDRILKAYNSVLGDALMHGEGFKIENAGTLLLHRYTSNNVKMFGTVKPRKLLYKHKWSVSAEASRYLEYLSDITRNRELKEDLKELSD